MGKYLVALSKTQNKRLGILLSVMFAEELTDDDVKEVVEQNLVEKVHGNYMITELFFCVHLMTYFNPYQPTAKTI